MNGAFPNRADLGTLWRCPQISSPVLCVLIWFQCALSSDHRHLQLSFKDFPQATTATWPSCSRSSAESWSAWGLICPLEALANEWLVHKYGSSSSLPWTSSKGLIYIPDIPYRTFCETLKYYLSLASSPSLSCFPHFLSSSFWEHFHNADLISRPDSGKLDLKYNFYLFFEF